jgi:hypothetical protein
VLAKAGTIIQENCQTPATWWILFPWTEDRGQDHQVFELQDRSLSLSPHAALLLRRPSYLGIRAVENVSGVIVPII